MKTILINVASLMFALALCGCGKKEEPVPAPAPVAPAAAPAAVPAAVQNAAIIPDARLAESQAAIKAGEYDKAAEALISLRRTQMSEQQAAVAAAQMRQLQGSLAQAVASGDPRAKAAADRLRQSALTR